MTTFLDAAWATDKNKPLEHQDKAWAYAWGVLSKEQQAEFLKRFRNTKIVVKHHSSWLGVEYMSQRDNYRDANRTCFSSSCAMLLKYLKSSSIKTDDDYIKVVFTFGDTTEGATQVETLKHFGLPTVFMTGGNRALIQKQINAGKPVPVGFLHKGPVSKPTGGGHWLCIIGYDATGYWVNDPWGDCDLLTGTYPSTNGANLHYSYKNFEPRWMVDGPNTGWCILA